MIILGVNAYHGDASAALVVEGKLVACVEEERFNRIKHSCGFPAEAVKFCLKQAGISLERVDYIAVPRDPKARLLRKLYYGIKIPGLFIRRLAALRKTRDIKLKLAEVFKTDAGNLSAKVINVEHHRAHIASSFFVSPFERAVFFSADGMGDFASTAWGLGEGNRIKIGGEICFPHSLGMFYTAITQYLGFLGYGDEYKVMGLAAYGAPRYRQEFEKIVGFSGKGAFSLGLKYFMHHKKLVDMDFEEGYPSLELLYSFYLEELLGRHRKEGEPLEARHENIAATLQLRLEEIILGMLNALFERYKVRELCLSGGVAFNCVVNGKIFERTPFEEVYIPPAPGDAGLSIGAAFYVWNALLGKPRDFVMEHAYWGPEFNLDEINSELKMMDEELKKQGCAIVKIEDEDELCRKTAQAISEGRIVGWFQARTEWGPRALGNRSILVDPRRPEMKDALNKRIKHRELFRPFAPSILEEKTGEYFKDSHPSPFMLFTHKVRPEKVNNIPAPTHVDGSGRLQTVNRRTNPRFWKLIREFENITGVPVLLNTSFNENEPIVNTPKEALECFLRTRMGLVVLGNFIVYKQNESIHNNSRAE